MHILFITPYPLMPNDSGGSIRVSALRDGLRSLGHFVEVVEIDPGRRTSNGPLDGAIAGLYEGNPRRTRASLLLRALSPTPEPSLALRNRSLRRRLMAVDGDYDVVVLHQAQLAIYLGAFAITPCIIDAQNLEHDLYSQLALRSTGAARKLRYWTEGQKFRRLEWQAFRSAASIISVSELDALRIQSFSGIRPAVIPNGVDTHAIPFSLTATNPSGAIRVLFVGSLGYIANIRAVQRLHDKIMPLVRRRIPDATLVIVGRGPSPEVLRLGSSPLTEVHADVPEVLPFYRTSHVVAIPLDLGGGTRLKALEAMAAGVPIVATPVALEGLPILDEIHAVVATEDAAFADGIVRASADPRLRRSLSTAGRALVEDGFEWRRLSAAYAEELRALNLSAAGRRRRH